jgi:glycosyltransferase involved in cell wall biosynthesis
VFDWLKSLRKKVGKLVLPDREERAARNKTKINLKPYTPEPKAYLGQLAYLLLSNFEILTNELKYAPTTQYKAELSEAAAKSFEKYRTVSKKLAGLGVDVTDSMDPFTERIDTFHSRTSGVDWYEAIIKIYLVSGLLDDFYKRLAVGLNSELRESVEKALSDKTFEKLQEYSSDFIKVVRHPHNLGYGRSLKDGIDAATFDTIVIIDCDLSYPFERVGDLLKLYNQGFDMVVGARTGKFYKESVIKSPLRKILRFLVEFTAGRSIPDINSGFRIFSKQTAKNYSKHLCETFSFTTSITLAYMMTGKTVKYTDIIYHAREGKTKVKLFSDSLRTLQYIIQAVTYYNPLKIFLLFSLFCFACSVIGFCASIFFGLQSGFLLGIGGLLICLIIMCFGLVADLLKQIMDK